VAPVCRFYGVPAGGPNSHFFTASAAECDLVKRSGGWFYEGIGFYILPVGADDLERCEPVYESLPGWKESTVGVKRFEALPKEAQAYLKRMESLCDVPVDMISTGPDREETIVLRHPFK